MRVQFHRILVSKATNSFCRCYKYFPLFQAKSRKGKPDSVLADVKRTPSPAENLKPSQEPADKQSSSSQNAVPNRAVATPSRPRTPPPREEAFEQFREEKGKLLNDVMIKNKGQSLNVEVLSPTRVKLHLVLYMLISMITLPKHFLVSPLSFSHEVIVIIIIELFNFVAFSRISCRCSQT